MWSWVGGIPGIHLQSPAQYPLFSMPSSSQEALLLLPVVNEPRRLDRKVPQLLSLRCSHSTDQATAGAYPRSLETEEAKVGKMNTAHTPRGTPFRI